MFAFTLFIFYSHSLMLEMCAGRRMLLPFILEAQQPQLSGRHPVCRHANHNHTHIGAHIVIQMRIGIQLQLQLRATATTSQIRNNHREEDSQKDGENLYFELNVNCFNSW